MILDMENWQGRDQQIKNSWFFGVLLIRQFYQDLNDSLREKKNEPTCAYMPDRWLV